jgi:hypothetical protein
METVHEETTINHFRCEGLFRIASRLTFLDLETCKHFKILEPHLDLYLILST